MKAFWYKKSKKTISVLCIFIMLGGLLPRGMIVHAAPSTQQQIDQAENEKNELENQQQQSESELIGLKQEKNTLQGELYNLNSSLEEVGYHLEDLEDQIYLKEADIRMAEAALAEAEIEIEEQYNDMVLRVRQMYERNDKSILNAILSVGSLAELLNIEDYYEKIERYDQKKLAEFKENRQAIADEKVRLENEHAELEVLRAEAQAESERVTELIGQTQVAVNQYQADIAETEAAIEAYEEAIAKKEADLEYLYKKLEEEKALAALAANSAWRDISQVSFEEGDRYLLANLIYCEAGGEPYEGQVAVGAVVINRLLSSVYPDTITGVIYQPSQFSPAGSGRLALALSVNKATANCYKAADEAMSGYSNVGSCLYFRTPIPGLTGTAIGGHIFY